MTNQQIIDGLPDKNLTHFDGNYYWQFTNENGWCRYCNPIAKLVVGEPSGSIMRLSDIEELARLERENEVLKDRLKERQIRESNQSDRITELSQEKFKYFGDKDYWIFQDDGEDYPESLFCPVTMSASKLRELLACREQLEAIKTERDELKGAYILLDGLKRRIREAFKIWPELEMFKDLACLMNMKPSREIVEQFAAKKQIEVLEQLRMQLGALDDRDARSTSFALDKEITKLRTNAGGDL